MRTPSTDRLLEIYLQDHHAAACAGAATARRASENVTVGVELGEALSAVATEIEEDRLSLEQLMTVVGVEPSSVKDATGSLAERLSRLKLNGEITSRSPLSDVIELEALIGGIAAKEALWWSLQLSKALVGTDAEDEPSRLLERAAHQLVVVQSCRHEAAARAFGHADAGMSNASSS